MTIKSKLTWGSLLLGTVPVLLAVMVVSWKANEISYQGLRSQTENQLMSIREMKKEQIENFFQITRDQIRTYSKNQMIIDSIGELKESLGTFSQEVRSDAPLTQDEIIGFRQELMHYYSTAFTAEYKNRNGGKESNILTPLSQLGDTAIALQHYYVQANPEPLTQKKVLNTPNDDSYYSMLHERYHPSIREYQESFGFSDIYLVDTENGNVLYSVQKSLDYGTSLKSGPFADTQLGRVFEEANAAEDVDFILMSDFSPYFASFDDAKSFVASPIFQDGTKIGVLIFQMPLERINSIMTFEKNWVKVGLGNSGQTYLVGPDSTMRSQSRLLLEDQEHYFRTLENIEMPNEIVKLIQAKSTSIGLHQIETMSVKRGLAGESGLVTFHDYRGEKMLSAYSSLDIPDLQWVIISEIDEQEAFQSMITLKNQILMTTTMIVGIFLVFLIPASLGIGRRGTQKINTIQEAANQMADGNYSARVTVHSQDEIGQLGTAFNLMAQEIQSNIAQGKEFEGKMAAVSKAQAVVEFQMDGTILTANDNFCQTLGYPLAEIQGQHHRLFVDPADASSPAYAAFWAKLNRGEYDAGVYKRIGKSGKEVWIQASYNPILDAQNKPWKVVKLATDITAEKNTAADFEGKMTAISKAQAVVEFQMDGTILTANDNFCQTLGYRLEEIQGQHHRLFADSADASSSAYAAFWAKLNRGEFDAGVYKRIGKGGKEVWIQASYNPIFDANHKPCKVVKFATDITGQKQAQNEVERLIEAAAQGQLAERIATAQFEGSSKELTEGFNRLLTAVETPLTEARTVLVALAEGDLSQQMTGAYKGQFGEIKTSLNTAITNLMGIVDAVRGGAVQVSAASEEITKGNEDLSQRTSAQAAALEETSTSMEEMTSTIKQNADNAKEANQLAVTAREVAEKGGAVTEKAVSAMGEINKSSKKIADIINVIDEIAFQTNLLALNAAVEAARAGEQGRGFAVVASEVRNLAQRSATAAKEIKSLINESVQKVGDGSDLVNQSGQTLEEIVNSVKRVTDIIAEISAASQEQASGIDQVNKAVMQMDQGTQQNAALVEKATLASQSMRQQAGVLLEQVDYFKLQDDSNVSISDNSSNRISST